MKVATISFCYKSLDLFGALDRIREAGYEYVELWFDHLGGEANYKIHSLDQADQLLRAIERRNLTPVSYCIGTVSPDDVAQLSEAFKFAKTLGMEIVNGDFDDWATLPLIDRIAAENDMRFALENHWHAPTLETPDDLRRALDMTSPAIGVNLDIGQLVAAGIDPIAALDQVRDRLYHLQFQDLKHVGGYVSVMPGEGVGRLRDVVAYLKEMHFDGIVSVEHDEQYEVDRALVAARRMLISEDT